MKKLRSYFEEKMGKWAEHLTDEQIESMVISFLNGKGAEPPVSQHSIDNTKENLENIKTKFSKFNITKIKNYSIPYYDVEIEDVSFTEGLLTSKYNGKSKIVKRYEGTIVEDKISNNKKGMRIRGTYDEAFDVDGGIIIKNGRTLFVSGMSVKDIPKKTENMASPVRISDRIKTQVEGISGYDRFMIKEDVFENNWKKFFANAESKDKIESIYPMVSIDRDSSSGFVNITINTTYRTDGIDYPSLIFNAVMYSSASRGIVKSEYE